MKVPSSQYGLLATLVASATAFPSQLMEEAARNPETVKRAMEILSVRGASPSSADAATAIFEPTPIFDAKTQFVDVGPGSGHEWKAPTSSDIRGPCPGL